MAKRRRRSTTQTRKNNEVKRKSKNNDINLRVIGIMVFSVLLAVLLYTNSGEIGQKLNEILGGLLGILRYVLPIGTFCLAIKIASKDDTDITSKLLQYAILLICIAIVMSVYEISEGRIKVVGDLSLNLKTAYSLGTANQGGGAIGTLAAIFLVKMLGNLGAVVLSVGVSIMLFAFIYGIDISEFISKKKEEQEWLKWQKKEELFANNKK